VEIIILGCGSSVGSPVIGRDLIKDFNNKDFRTRSSVLIKYKGQNILIDTGADFRYQALKNNIKEIDFVLFTHSHADHTHGIDDLRIFSYMKGEKINCYANHYTIRDLKKNFSYIFDSNNNAPRPRLSLIEVEKQFSQNEVEIIPLPIKHKDWDIFGYRIDNFAYITDCSSIPESTISKLSNLDVLILDSLRFSSHDAHLSVNEAIEISERINPNKTFLTHMSSELKYDDLKSFLPDNISPGFDGMRIKI